MKRPRQLEKEILAQCRDYLRLQGWMCLRLNSGAVAGEYKGKRRFVRFNDTPGCSDLLAVKDGAVLFLEVKRPGEKLLPAQAAFLEEARRHGAAAFVVHSLDALIRELEVLNV